MYGCSEKHSSAELTPLGLPSSSVFVLTHDGKKYVHRMVRLSPRSASAAAVRPIGENGADSIRVDSIVRFVERVLQGKAKHYIKSGKRPTNKQNSGPVKTVIGNTFEQMITYTIREMRGIAGKEGGRRRNRTWMGMLESARIQHNACCLLVQQQSQTCIPHASHQGEHLVHCVKGRSVAIPS